MPQVNFKLEDEADEIVIFYSKKWKMNKPDTLNEIIKKFEEIKVGNNR